MDLGSKIAKLRKKAGYSQEQLANKMGVSRQSVFKWESGENTPDLEKIKKLTNLFHVTFDDLLNEEIDIDAPKTAEVVLTPAATQEPAKEKKGHLVVLSLLCAASLVAVISLGGVFIANTVQQNSISQSNQEMADQVIAMIDALGEITKDSKSDLDAIEAAYNSLSVSQKNLVRNYSVYLQARERYDSLMLPSRSITLEDIHGAWKSSSYVWKIKDIGTCSSVLYYTLNISTGTSKEVSGCSSSSSIKGFDEDSKRQIINLVDATSSEAIYEISAYQSEEGIVTFTYQNQVFQKIGD